MPETSTSASSCGSCRISPAVNSGLGVSCSASETCGRKSEKRLPETVLLALELRGGTERIGEALGRALVVGREGDAHVAVVEDGVVGPVGPVDLVQGLGDQERPHAVAGQEGERGLEEVEPPERRELVQHEQEPGPGAARGDFGQRLGEPAGDLVEDQAHERPRARDVGGRHDQVERDRPLGRSSGRRCASPSRPCWRR